MPTVCVFLSTRTSVTYHAAVWDILPRNENSGTVFPEKKKLPHKSCAAALVARRRRREESEQVRFLCYKS